MGRIVEIAIAANAIAGIMAFLGVRYSIRKSKDKILDSMRKLDEKL